MENRNDPLLRVKTLEEARSELTEKGQSISDWARKNGFSINLVFDVLGGRKKCLRGQSHQIAIILGIKTIKAPKSN